MIEVFVRSSSVHMDVGTIREMSYHIQCSPDTAPALINMQSRFKGRVLPQDDYLALQRMEELTNKFHDNIKVYDVSRALDRMRALKRGILKTPTAFVQGRKYEGLDKILELVP